MRAYKMTKLPKTTLIKGKRYYHKDNWHLRPDALREAKRLRGLGYKARVVKRKIIAFSGGISKKPLYDYVYSVYTQPDIYKQAQYGRPKRKK